MTLIEERGAVASAVRHYELQATHIEATERHAYLTKNMRICEYV